jgi:hypothetical protein
MRSAQGTQTMPGWKENYGGFLETKKAAAEGCLFQIG